MREWFMRFTATEIAAVTNGTVVGPDVTCVRASIDSRTIVGGELFVPIVGVRDGHDFVAGAQAAGCGAYLTRRAPEGGTAIVVEDTAEALTALGREARRRHQGPVIGITGSVGKTSVKDLALAAIGKGCRTHANERSFNNELGVPLTLINAPEDTEVLIVEMGARGIGQIAELCEIARPTIGIVTFVGAVHTSEFGNIEAVAEAKGELVKALPADGIAILNADCAPVLAMQQLTSARTITYGVDGDFAAEKIQIDERLRPRFQVAVGSQIHDVELDVHGVHQVSNALAALAAAQSVDVKMSQAIGGLANAVLSPWRMEIARTRGGATIINDAYNANAMSTAAALHSLAAIEASRRIAVLGLMAELGDRHDQGHRDIAVLCDELGIRLIAYQEPAYGVEPEQTHDAVIEQIGDLGPSDAVLVKGSRLAELEKLAVRLLSDPLQ